MCAKLREAEARTGGGLRGLIPFAAAAAGGGWLYHSYTSRGWLYSVVKAERARRKRSSVRLAATPLSAKRTYEF